MNVLGIDRVLIATSEIDPAVESFDGLLDLDFGACIDPTDTAITNRMSSVGVEFVTGEEGSAVGRFLAERGPGLYALALRVADLDAAREHLADQGVEPIDSMTVNAFRELYYHPREFEGTLLVLAEYDAPHPAEIAARASSERTTTEDGC